MPVQSFLAIHSRMVETRNPHNSPELRPDNFFLFPTEKTALKEDFMVSTASRRI
jgi:hypothetical protein